MVKGLVGSCRSQTSCAEFWVFLVSVQVQSLLQALWGLVLENHGFRTSPETGTLVSPHDQCSGQDAGMLLL